MTQTSFAFDTPASARALSQPAGYTGLYAFHKYWGKKPAETLSFLIEKLSSPGELVVDPFLGSGAVAREAAIRRRKFIGCDLNPVAVELASFLVTPPSSLEFERACSCLESAVRLKVDSSYRTADGTIATHYLWRRESLAQVWTKSGKGRLRIELVPTDFDLALLGKFRNYTPVTLRPLRIFKNTRINARAGMQWHDLFTRRALRNLELLRQGILDVDDQRVRQSLLLALTAAMGQMSKMVFAIEKRGKLNGTSGHGRVEVGSWVIGFWCPEVHFEINAWNCFSNKTTAMLRALRTEEQTPTKIRLSHAAAEVLAGRADVAVAGADAIDYLAQLPDSSIDLLITDPPHGDRIPYLELSEPWNAIVDKTSLYDDEIVVSDANERGLTFDRYAQRINGFFGAITKKLSSTGRVALMFNSRSAKEWQCLATAASAAGLKYVGCFPMTYSARSVVQDNREGALKYDYVLVFSPSSQQARSVVSRARLRELPNWSEAWPSVEE